MKIVLSLALLLFGVVSFAQTNDPLEGKRIGVLGDSYVKNHKRVVEETWHYKMAKRHNMIYYNYGRNGNCISIDLKNGDLLCIKCIRT
ncbi:MAG: hypothetical protein Q4D41_02425 [Prevotellaceae bacterium]|nr:hypothetical protein [Prevotellaceae bacterium]